MRITALTAFLGVFLLFLPVSVPAAGHAYVTGTFQGIGARTIQVKDESGYPVEWEMETIRISGTTYQLADDPVVFMSHHKGNRSTQNRVNIKVLRDGDPVKVKKMGKIVEEIWIERWR